MTGVQLRIGTWNCFGMGQGLDAVMHLRAPFGHRFLDADVHAVCSSPDVLCVQEILSRDAQRFFDAVGGELFASRFRDDNRIRLFDGSVRGTGLGLGARRALKRTLLRSFAGRRLGWDRLARKGALYAELALDGERSIDIVTVHLQAGYDGHAAHVRAAQLVELRRMIDEMGSPERPFVVCGDFNIDGLEASRGSQEYRTLAAVLEGFTDLGAEQDLPTFHPHPEGNGLAHAFEPDAHDQRIDYIFLRPPVAGGDARCVAVERFLDRPLVTTTFGADKAGWASDHYGLCATIEIELG